MITNKDINKLKESFVTKEDLQKSTDQLIELITDGFNRMDESLEKLNEHDDILSNHQRRLDQLENKILA